MLSLHRSAKVSSKAKGGTKTVKSSKKYTSAEYISEDSSAAGGKSCCCYCCGYCYCCLQSLKERESQVTSQIRPPYVYVYVYTIMCTPEHACARADDLLHYWRHEPSS